MGVVYEGRTSGRTRVEFTSAPDRETARLARFTAQLAAEQHRSFMGPPRFVRKVRSHGGASSTLKLAPEVRWFLPDGRRRGFAPLDTTKGWIALSADLRGEEVVPTVLHEVRHLAQQDVAMSDAESEMDAVLYARKWAKAFVKAYRAANGQVWKVAFVRGRRPQLRAPHTHIRLSTNAHAWRYSVRAGWIQLT